jgi:hypothetical protein
MFRYSAYHLILHWNHYLCSSALGHWLATVSPLTVLGTFPFPVLLIISLPLYFCGDEDYIRDDVWLLRISFNSTIESLPYLCSQPLTGNSFAIDCLGNLPDCFLCSWSYPFLVFSIKRHWRLSVLLTTSCFLFSRSRSSYMVPSSDTIKRVTCFLLL